MGFDWSTSVVCSYPMFDIVDPINYRIRQGNTAAGVVVAALIGNSCHYYFSMLLSGMGSVAKLREVIS